MYVGTYDSEGNYHAPCTPPDCKNIRRREVKQKSEQDRFKEIAKTAADATATILDIIRKLEGLEERNVIMNDLSDLAYQLGYIEGLSYVPEEEENE